MKCGHCGSKLTTRNRDKGAACRCIFCAELGWANGCSRNDSMILLHISQIANMVLERATQATEPDIESMLP